MVGVEISKKLVLINSASSAVTLLLNLSVLVWLQQYLLKRISPEEYSLLPIVMALMAFAPLISTVLTGGIGQFITVAYAKGDNHQVTRICSTMLPILTGAAGLMLLTAGGAIWQMGRLLNVPPERLSDVRIMLAMLVVSGALRLPLSVFGAGFIVRQKLMLNDAISIGCQIFKFALLFALLLGVSTRVIWVVTATAVSEIAQLIIVSIISLRLIPAQRFNRRAIHWPLAREIVSYGSWSLADRMAQTAKEAMNPLLLNRFSNAVGVATFHVAGIAPRQLVMLLGPIAQPFIPILAAFHATEDMERMKNTYLRIARYQVWVLFAVAVPTAIFADEIMGLYLGGRYPVAGSVMALLVFVPVFGAFNALGPAVAYARGQVRGFSIRHLAVQTFNVALTLLLVAYLDLGARGCAAATLITSATVEVLLTWSFCWKITGTRLSNWVGEVFLPTMIPAIPSVGLCFLAKRTFELDTWLVLFSVSGLSATIYVALVSAFGIRSQDKVDLLRLADRAPPFLSKILHLMART